jgi:hypothetical protein
VSGKKSRLRKKGIDIEMPTTGATQFKTRAEFNDYVKQMQSFINPHNMNYQYVKNTQGVVFTKKELNELERQIKTINRLKESKRKEIERLKLKHKGKELEFTALDQMTFMKDKRYENLIPLTFNPNRYRNKKELGRHLSQLKTNIKANYLQKMDRTYKDNYLSAVETLHGLTSELYKVVDKMPLKKFMQFYYTENLADIKYLYDETLRKATHDLLVDIYKGE